MRKPIKKLYKALITVLAVAVLPLQLFALSGCSLLAFLLSSDTIEFTRSSLTMYVGDTYDLSTIIESTESYELSVSPSSVASLSGATITALKAGSATVTAETFSDYDTLSLTVKEKPESTLLIETDGSLLQNINNLNEVVFVPKATGDIGGGIDWYVNGAYVQTTSASLPFKYTPSKVGEYVISARMGSLSATKTIRVYYPVTASCSYSGEVTQETPDTTPISFTATVSENPQNPANVFEWFVDGVKSNTDNAATFTYIPTAGTHTITLKVNGELVPIDDRDYVTVICTGAIVPSVPTIEFDNLYPHVYLNHDGEGSVCVEITPPSGSAAEYSQNDSRYASLFEQGRVDVGSLISLCSGGSARGVYKFRIKSLGDGGALRESDYSAPLSFTQLPKEAGGYLSELYYDKDYYITSDEEYVNILEYKIISRPKTVNSKVSFEVYIGYELSGSAKDLWNEAFPIAATSGSYTGISVSMSNKVMSTSFKVDTVNTPTKQTADSSRSTEYSTQLHAIIPHINYDESKYRDEAYSFYIDKLKKTQSVSYTDELYLAAQNNTRPVPAAGSSAETVYNLARKVLRKIVTDDMTDAQKAHAIYDWIMWQVTYDTPATTYRGVSENLSAYYLEGVFGDGVTPIGGVVYKPYAVCDGMSKAYSLLCNMEGIPCIRIPGLAGSDLRSAGGHAWNKVKIDGEWYIVDCTWGDVTGTLSIDGKLKDYELGVHDHLFITDSMVEGNHFESHQSGETSIVYAPETAVNPYPVYSEYLYNGVTINCEVLDGDNPQNRVSSIARSFAAAYTPRSSIKVPGYGSGEYSVRYEGIEIYFPGGVNINSNTLSSTVTSAVRSVLPRADVKVLTYSDIVIILLDA